MDIEDLNISKRLKTSLIKSNIFDSNIIKELGPTKMTTIAGIGYVGLDDLFRELVKIDKGFIKQRRLFKLYYGKIVKWKRS